VADTVFRIPIILQHGRSRGAGQERGRRGDSIQYLTYRGDASWWPDFAGEEGGGALLRVVALLFLGVRGCIGQCRRRRARGKARHGAGRRAGSGRAGALVAAVWLEALCRGGAGMGAPG
jgi:hypothetical protein